ncbi:MAG: PP2C family protein-serine/threonine phosphatase, partial [Anaerolineales bacterium]
FEQETLSLAPEEIIVIYSDGVTEAEDHSEALFGESRLQEIIKQNKQLTAKQLIDKIYADVQFFARGKKQDDDITMVIIKAV